MFLPDGVHFEKEQLMSKNLENDGETVLVVDDDLAQRQLLQMFLTDRGYNVRVADSPISALEAVSWSADVDFAFIDINYAGSTLNGFDLAALFIQRGLHFPFVIMSMDDDLQNHQKSEKVGALAFVEKTYDSMMESIQYVASILKTKDQNLSIPHRIFNRNGRNAGWRNLLSSDSVCGNHTVA